MNNAKEITDDSTPNEVVAYLNNRLQSSKSPYTIRDVLTDIQDEELTLPRFNTSATLMANTVNYWFGDSGGVYIVCDGLNSPPQSSTLFQGSRTLPALLWCGGGRRLPLTPMTA